MRALQLDFGNTPPIALNDVPRPRPPSTEWASVRPVLSGVCGSDLSLLSLSASMFLAPYLDVPGTLGHEIVGLDEDGNRVVVDAVLGCEALGRDSFCPPCSSLEPQLCRRFGEDAGALVGYAGSVGGGWSEELIVPRRNLFSVPPELPAERAVLLEPLAVMLHAAMLRPIRSPVLIVGGGVIGLCGVAVVKALRPGTDVVVVARHDHQLRAAERAGAVAIAEASDGSHHEELAALSRARLSGPSLERPTVAGGFPVVLECVGTSSSIELAFRMTEERGSTVLVGASGYSDGLDLAPTFVKELEVLGSYCYGYERVDDAMVRTFDYLLGLVRSGSLEVGGWVTHVFPLEEHRAAIEAAQDKATGSLRVAFRP